MPVGRSLYIQQVKGIKVKERNPFLWNLRSDTRSDSYLFGTMHISEGKDIDKLGLVKDKIYECDMFATEMDLGQRSLMDVNAFHLDTPLSTKMNANHYQRCQKVLLRSFDIDLNVIGTLKPLIITNMIAEVVLGKTGCIGLDQYLYNYAAEAEKELGGVEKVSEQGDIMNLIPLDYQIKALRSIAKNPKSFRRNVLSMNDLYRQGDLRRLHKKAKRSLGKMRKPLLYDRNKIMTKRIKHMISEKSSFIAIGAGHLSGGKGVLRLLKQSGIKISRVL